MRYFKRVDDAGLILTVESYSHTLPISGAIEISEVEFNDFIKALPLPEALPQVSDRIEALEARVAQVEVKTANL